jgi:hypothetical protein
MIIRLTNEQSILYLDDGWAAWCIEEDVLDDLARQGVTEPVAVLLSDASAVAFYVTAPGVIV